jgi:hypothetical protein
MLYIIIVIAQVVAIYFLSKMVITRIAWFILGLTRDKKRTIFILAVIFLPGTFLHEISHFLMALFLLVPVWNIELLPEIDDNSSDVKMGSVPIGQTDPIRRMIIGVAPFILGLTIILGGMFYLSSNLTLLTVYPWLLLPITYCLFTFSNTMFSSSKDLEGSLEFLAIVIVIALVFYFLKIPLPNELIPPNLQEQLMNFIKQSAIFLIIPIILQLITISSLKLITRR